jgi:hypothetical protein
LGRQCFNGNKAEVLELQGKEEAKKYWTEAKLFKSLFENSYK